MNVTWRIYQLLRPYSRPILGGLVCLLISTAMMLAQPRLWQEMVDEVLIHHKVERFWPVVLIMIVCGFVAMLTAGLRFWLLEKTGQRMVLELRQRIYAHLQSQPLAFFHERRTGDLLSRVVGDVDTLQDVVINGTDTFLTNLLGMIGVAIMLIYLDVKLGVCTVAPVFITLFLTFRYNRLVKPIYRAGRDRLGDVSAKLQENLGGVQTVKAFAREEEAAGRFQQTIAACYDYALKAIGLRTVYMPAVQFLSFFGSVIMISYGAYLVMNEGLTLGVLVAYRGYWWHLYGPVYSIATINDMLQRASAAAARIFELLDHQPELRDAPDAKDLPRIQGEVRLEDVSFHYGKPASPDVSNPKSPAPAATPGSNGTSETKRPADPGPTLEHINLLVRPGQRVGLVGPSGAGKSTLMGLIPRFFDPQAGRILIDGHDLRHVTQASLRRQIGMVLQESFLFNDTIGNNIRFGRPGASQEDVERAARESNAHEFIARLPQGYDTLVGERGVKLSGGQRQRVAIARAFLANPAILLLDEATSAVEAESETIIQQALERLMAGRTAFIISHRLSAIRNCDMIVAIDDGRIAEQGTHAELMERNGLYAGMYRMQMGEEAVNGAR